jgi:hypothetical protein
MAGPPDWRCPVTGLNAIAQWLAGGGGSVLKVILYIVVAWLLIGGLPKMRRDAARKVPQVRGDARNRMRDHAARAQGHGKPAEWWGWTAVWGALSAAGAAAGFGRYMVTSAWHGWGDHRARLPRRRRSAEPPRDIPETTPPDDPGTPPPGDGGGTVPPEPPRPPAVRPAEPPRPETATAPVPPEPPRPAVPVPPTGGNGGEEIPMRPRNSATEGNPVEEITNLEAAIAVVSKMQQEALREFDAAGAEKANAEKALAGVEQASADLASAGVSGPVMDAFVRYHEAMEQASLAAAGKLAAYEAAKAAADAMRGALASHQDAADSLAATGGAANRTGWYGA